MRSSRHYEEWKAHGCKWESINVVDWEDARENFHAMSGYLEYSLSEYPNESVFSVFEFPPGIWTPPVFVAQGMYGKEIVGYLSCNESYMQFVGDKRGETITLNCCTCEFCKVDWNIL
jgi:hypothetical protein